MSRLTGPSEASRYITQPSSSAAGAPIVSLAGVVVTVYTTSGGATLADIQTTAGAAITGSVLTLTSSSGLPDFLLPDSVDTVWGQAAGSSTRFPIYALEDARLDSLGTRVAALETGGSGVASVNTRTGAVVLAKADVGLGSVDNSADTAKPVSTAQQTALNLKLDTSSANGSFLSQAAGAGLTQGVSSVAGRTGVVALTKTDVGLANADNTSDVNKPVSTAQRATFGGPFPTTSRNVADVTAFTVIGGANRAAFQRLEAIGPGSAITSIAIGVRTSSGNVCVGAYTSGAGRANPTTRIATSGSVPCPASGTSAIVLDVAITPTVDTWFAISCDNNTATFDARTASSNYGGNPALGASAFQDAAFPLPASVAPAALRTPGYILVGA